MDETTVNNKEKTDNYTAITHDFSISESIVSTETSTFELVTDETTFTNMFNTTNPSFDDDENVPLNVLLISGVVIIIIITIIIMAIFATLRQILRYQNKHTPRIEHLELENFDDNDDEDEWVIYDASTFV